MSATLGALWASLGDWATPGRFQGEALDFFLLGWVGGGVQRVNDEGTRNRGEHAECSGEDCAAGA